jgi:protein-L-isoaspartate(D-aspartate) O-methyltransferase
MRKEAPMDGFRIHRETMVDQQLAARGISDERVLAAMGAVPRECFVPAKLREFAYDDRPLPIEAGQTISQPYIVALMLAAAHIQPDDHILEIGVGSGYAAAVASRMAKQVHAIDRHEMLSHVARGRMAALGYDNVSIHTGDGTKGLPDQAPFDVILISAGAPRIPEALRAQLAPNGRLIGPVGGDMEQHLIRVTLGADGLATEEDLGLVRFVPLIGAQGWDA